MQMRGVSEVIYVSIHKQITLVTCSENGALAITLKLAPHT